MSLFGRGCHGCRIGFTLSLLLARRTSPPNFARPWSCIPPIYQTARTPAIHNRHSDHTPSLPPPPTPSSPAPGARPLPVARRAAPPPYPPEQATGILPSSLPAEPTSSCAPPIHRRRPHQAHRHNVPHSGPTIHRDRINPIPEHLTHDNTERPHSGIRYRRPRQVRFTVDPEPGSPLQIRCRSRLAGVLRHYYRRAG